GSYHVNADTPKLTNMLSFQESSFCIKSSHPFSKGYFKVDGFSQVKSSKVKGSPAANSSPESFQDSSKEGSSGNIRDGFNTSTSQEATKDLRGYHKSQVC